MVWPMGNAGLRLVSDYGVDFICTFVGWMRGRIRYPIIVTNLGEALEQFHLISLKKRHTSRITTSLTFAIGNQP